MVSKKAVLCLLLYLKITLVTAAGVSHTTAQVPPNTTQLLQVSATPAQELHALVLQSNIQRVTLGKTREDYDLWAFASQLKANEHDARLVTNAFAGFEDQLLFAVSQKFSALQQMVKDVAHFTVKPAAKVAGSMRNLTNLDNSDIDIIVVLNDGPGNAIQRNVSANKHFWPDKEVIPVGAVKQLAECFRETVDALLANFIPEEVKLMSFNDKKLRFTCKMVAGAVELEFDILGAMVDITGAYQVIDGELASFEYSANELAAKKLERLANTYVGFQELIKVLKLTSKIEARQNQAYEAAHLPSCAFETAVIELTAQRDSGWDNSPNFWTLFHKTLEIIKAHLQSGNKPLPAPNAPKSDVLQWIRASPNHCAAVEQYINKWLAITEQQLLESLKQCLVAYQSRPAS